jgi:hypothetical protein
MAAEDYGSKLFEGFASREQLLTDPSSPFLHLSKRTLLRFEAAGLPVIRRGRKVRLYDLAQVRRWLTGQAESAE